MIGQTGGKKLNPCVNLEGVLMLLQLRSEFHFEDVILRHNFFLMAISSKVKLQHLSPRPPLGTGPRS